MFMQKSLLAAVLGLAFVAGCSQYGKVETDADGTTETVIKMADVPQVITFAFNKEHPRVTPNKVKKEVYKDGTVHYEFSWLDADKKEVEVEYSSTGEKLD